MAEVVRKLVAVGTGKAIGQRNHRALHQLRRQRLAAALPVDIQAGDVTAQARQDLLAGKAAAVAADIDDRANARYV